MKDSPLRHRARAFTLVEVMISTTIFLLAVTAILAALIFFLRAHQSYAQTAWFNSRVRQTQEQLLQELRNATAITTASTTEIAFSMHDLQGKAWDVRYYPNATGTAVRREAKPASGSTSDSEVFGGLASYSFSYFKRDGSDLGSAPTTLAMVNAVRLEITPKPRSHLLFGKDESTARKAGDNTVVNTVIQLRNKT